MHDWSAEGHIERENIYGPILDVLEEVQLEERESMRVLVPGLDLDDWPGRYLR